MNIVILLAPRDHLALWRIAYHWSTDGWRGEVHALFLIWAVNLSVG